MSVQGGTLAHFHLKNGFLATNFYLKNPKSLSEDAQQHGESVATKFFIRKKKLQKYPNFRAVFEKAKNISKFRSNEVGFKVEYEEFAKVHLIRCKRKSLRSITLCRDE